jgi:hypothetical protein
MPIHDWTRVDAGIFHAFHHDWITEIARTLNRGLLPEDYYALPEQHAAGFGPDVLTLQGENNGEDAGRPSSKPALGGGGVQVAAPKLQPIGETDLAFYRRKQKTVTVRHVSGDRIVAMVEIVSPGNKAARNAIRAFAQKAAELVERGIHLLILDLFPPGKRDPQGIHGEIWEEIAGQEYVLPTDKPLTLAAYESDLSIKAYVVHLAVGDELVEMPLFLEPRQAVHVPLEATYRATFAEVPRRWRRVLEGPTSGPSE